MEQQWDEFIKTIDFQKIEKIDKNESNENMDEGQRVRDFMKSFQNDIWQKHDEIKKFSKNVNQAPTQKYFSSDNGFRIGFYFDSFAKYQNSLQINITIGADWGGGVYLKDNTDKIFKNEYVLKYLEKNHKDLKIDDDEKTIFVLHYENKNDEIPSEKIVIEKMKLLAKIYKKIMEIYKMQKHIDILKSQKQIILQGPPGTGKTYLAKQIANEFCKNKEIIIFHPSYGYEDFIRGIEAKTDKNGNISYEVVDKVLLKMASKALASKDENFVLIIDEINRANLSAVLGELIYALEYRGEVANCMYEKNGSREIILPQNLYIIGTMNTADRSVGYIDYAIRRRFAFVDVLADKSLVSSESRFDEVREVMEEGISSEYNVDDIMIGHSYFMSENLEEKMKYQVIPLLKEYVKDGLLTPQVEEKVKELED